ncbi:3',5'-cyclic AMP phosphodiesterase CpdA [Noviherbaspirillum humi]|uniref:3',5'-cyclic AMP phosphodiesterase CpdA n=1 Tax=Noviherbaspirillum humi TaxID=1688639 RepID=A0A239JEW4_9BURK|nr:metallophosphoesterase [Noviherbaspirillum humi]SNT04142.1 3',5'-cyclic AMP phosphodiesterase CpdA [Noviherbaspirillum humi]
MTTIVHLSDTHFGTEVTPVLQAAAETIRALQPDVLVLSGDITQRARKPEFERARAFLDSLPPLPLVVIPGNHDLPLFNLPLRLVQPYAGYRRAFGDSPAGWSNGQVRIVGFDTTSRLRHTRGTLASDVIAAGLRRDGGEGGRAGLLIACVHQPLATAREEDAAEILIEADRIAADLARHGVDVVLSGHVHVPLATTTARAFPHVGRHFVLAGAGTAVSHRVRSGAPNSFNCLHVRSEGEGGQLLEVAQHHYQSGARTFRLARQDRFVRHAHGWEAADSPV